MKQAEPKDEGPRCTCPAFHHQQALPVPCLAGRQPPQEEMDEMVRRAGQPSESLTMEWSGFGPGFQAGYQRGKLDGAEEERTRIRDQFERLEKLCRPGETVPWQVIYISDEPLTAKQLERAREWAIRSLPPAPEPGKP